MLRMIAREEVVGSLLLIVILQTFLLQEVHLHYVTFCQLVDNLLQKGHSHYVTSGHLPKSLSGSHCSTFWISH